VWIDSHCHVTADAFEDDRPAVLSRAREDGVEAFVAIGSGYGIDHNPRALRLADAEPDVFATVGVHPHEAHSWDEAGRRKLAGWLDHPRVVAVGECGLDYHYTHSPREVQRQVFAEQLASARERKLPVAIHVRGDDATAYDEVLDLWRAEGRGELEGVLHCYTGSLDFARRAIGERLYVSFSGILTFKRDRGLRETARALPLDRLLVETDAPLLSPEGLRGKRNEPARVRRVGEVLAATRDLSVEAVAGATTRNARRLFRLPDA
jgi:TatD DNase family protein